MPRGCGDAGGGDSAALDAGQVAGKGGSAPTPDDAGIPDAGARDASHAPPGDDGAAPDVDGAVHGKEDASTAANDAGHASDAGDDAGSTPVTPAIGEARIGTTGFGPSAGSGYFLDDMVSEQMIEQGIALGVPVFLVWAAMHRESRLG